MQFKLMSSLELLSFLQKTPLLSSEIWSVYDPEMRLRSCAFDECHPEDINVLENLYCIFWNIIEENRDEYIATFTHIRNQLDDETEDLCQPAENHISFLQNLSIDPNFERLPELNIAIQCQESYCFAETYKMFSELNAFDLLIMQYYSEQHPLYSLMQEVDSIEEDLELEKILTDIKECKDS
ncbi:MAG: hypothetical protein FJ161_05185, partial [Gammaproteobacteria bacterium]|nr:hypothetical protein [Gammaproteobacteria bacterium]